MSDAGIYHIRKSLSFKRSNQNLLVVVDAIRLENKNNNRN